MICGCQKRPSAAIWLTRAHSLVSAPDPSPTAGSVTRRYGLLPSHGAQKNVLWGVRHDASQLLRPNTATRRQVRDLSSGPFRVQLDIEVRRIQCRQCHAVKRERLAFLADNPFYTQRFAYYGGRRCRSATIKDIAEELRLDWGAVKDLGKQYVRAQLKRAGTPGNTPAGAGRQRICGSDLCRHVHRTGVPFSFQGRSNSRRMPSGVPAA